MPTESTVTIHDLDENNVGHVNNCNGAFIVDSKLCLHAENGEINYSVVKVPEYEKRYPIEEVDYNELSAIQTKPFFWPMY